MGIIEFIIYCLKPVYEWLQALIWGKGEAPHAEPFDVSEYLQRREKLILELEEERRAEYVIVLWWGYDGLRLNKDGSWEWISRKKPEPEKQSAPIFIPPSPPPYPFYPTLYYGGDMCQSTQAQISALQAQNTALQIQAAQHAQNMAIIAATTLYPSYLSFQQELVHGTFPLTGCCCNQTILR